MEKMRILLADDHPLFREGIIAVLQGYEGFEIVGEAESGGEALRLAESLQPDLILMDISMPGVNGIEATRQIIATSPHIRILILTIIPSSRRFERVLAAICSRGLSLRRLSAPLSPLRTVRPYSVPESPAR